MDRLEPEAVIEPEQNPGLPRAANDEPACTEWLAVSGKLVRKEGLEPSSSQDSRARGPA
jgi:hypothetical protein